MIALIKFFLYVIILYILNFIAIKIMLINVKGGKTLHFEFYAINPFEYITGIIFVAVSKIFFDIKFHKIQKELERNLQN